jgi:hypothetical protein
LNTSKLGALGLGPNSISRRAALVSLGSTTLMLPGIVSGPAMKAAPSAINFYVAGTRFQRSVGGLRAGVAVSVIRGVFSGSFGYTIEVRGGPQIGYVPAKLVPLVETATVRAGWLSSVDYGTVPWKTFRVILELS